MSNYLGLDYGQAHVGVAIATGPLAEPLTTLPTPSAPQLIKKLIEDCNITTIIIGQPNISTKSGFEKFVNYLKIENCKLEIVEETLSSHDATQSLLHTTRKKRQTKEHSVAAAIILQSWLDSQPHS